MTANEIGATTLCIGQFTYAVLSYPSIVYTNFHYNTGSRAKGRADLVRRFADLLQK